MAIREIFIGSIGPLLFDDENETLNSILTDGSIEGTTISGTVTITDSELPQVQTGKEFTDKIIVPTVQINDENGSAGAGATKYFIIEDSNGTRYTVEAKEIT